ncbi:RIBOSOMAL PROTEIN S19P FAMILY MEMBER [Salix purpurea]|uniref:RIBOSOMAL PROTEIN S19P FAMILY MEMBER n=1 Tax=Salix purpurea TaxID=77065 RepID=A0A9Q0TXC6_SALPP|nr:RIBOSOMAL PROTEIN S19P FAMILY MEMBER [Salix purpurea]
MEVIVRGAVLYDPKQNIFDLCWNLDMKREAPAGEKPEPVRTHLRNMIIVPEMIGSIIGVYNGKTFNQVEIKPEMIGHYLAEFSISYKPVKHGRPWYWCYSFI